MAMKSPPAEETADALFPFFDQAFGAMDNKGRLVVPMDYQWVGDFVDGKAPALLNGKYGVIDGSGKVLIPFAYDDLGPWSEGRIRVEVDGRYGFIDWQGKVSVAPKFDDVGTYVEGIAWVRREVKFGFINLLGQEVIPTHFDAVHDFHEGVAGVLINGKWGFIGTKGTLEIPAQYLSVGNFCNGRAGVTPLSAQAFDYIDKQNQKVFSIKFFDEGEDAPDFKDGKLRVLQSGEGPQAAIWDVVYDTSGRVKERKVHIFDRSAVERDENAPAWIEFKPGAHIPDSKAWKRRNIFAELIPVASKRSWGYVDRSGTVKVKPIYDFAGSFSEGIAVAALPDNFVWLDASGNTLFQRAKVDYGSNIYLDQYHGGLLRFMGRGKMLSPSGGGAAAEYDDTYGAMDRNGKIVIPKEFQNLGAAANGFIFAKHRTTGHGAQPSDGAFFDLQGNRLFDCPFYSGGFSEGLAEFHFGYLDTHGKQVLYKMFSRVNNFSEGLAVAEEHVSRTAMSGYINHDGDWIIKPQFGIAHDFSDGIAVVSPDYKLWEFIDKKGNLVFPQTWANAWGFCDGLAKVTPYAGPFWNYGYINEKGNTVIPYIYDYTSGNFSNGMVLLRKNMRAMYADQKGKISFTFGMVEMEDDAPRFW